MIEELRLKEKGSHFHKYVRTHFYIGKDIDHPFYEEYIDRYTLWKKDFNYSHGKLDTQKKINVDKISFIFNLDISNNDDIFKFIFAIDSFYLSLLVLCAAKKIDTQYSEEKYHDYFSMAFFKNIDIGNYYLPSNSFLAINDENITLCLIALAKDMKSVSIFKEKSDLIREVFHEIYPKEIRHSLGEYYTPDWMAQYIIDSNLTSLNSGVTIDPTCGSGTFLITILQKLKLESSSENIIQRIIGFDINPISTFAAKTNLILNLSCKELSGELLPIFNANILDINLKNDTFLSYDEACNRIKKICGKNCKYYSDEDIHELELISKVMPRLSKERASLAVGNPPWVNWEYLPTEYRDKYKYVWQSYGLFDYKGISSVFIKEDISSLITYVTINHYLKSNGKISFVVKESLFKSIKQAAGFRKFYIDISNVSFGISLLEDMTSFNPFNGVNNNTVIFHAIKGKSTQYPVEYCVWTLSSRIKPGDTDNIDAVLPLMNKNTKIAIPSNPLDNTSGWASVTQELYEKLNFLTGKSNYKARTGVFTGGANGVFWLKIISKSANGSVMVENMTERAKIKVKKITTSVEDSILYPYASGSDIKMWSFTYKKYIICPHTVNTKMRPISMQDIENKLPLSADFFKLFKDELKARKGFTSLDKKIHDEHYHTLQRIGEYTFAKYKVAWKYIASKFTCAVICDVDDKYLGNKTVIPNEKIIYIGLNDRQEAYYLCGLLSSTYFRELINSFKVSTQIAPSTISNLNLPKFINDNETHKLISSLCEAGHRDLDNIESYINQIDHHILSAISPYKDQMNKMAFPAVMGRQQAFIFE